MDTITAASRSMVMTKVKSNGNRSTEWKLRASLIRAGIRGWKVNPGELPGSPDFVFPTEAVVVFTDGCFWHGCPTCKKVPSSNTVYWTRKIQRNRNRDKAVTALLRRHGWKVLRIWEHDLISLNSIVQRIANAICRRSSLLRPASSDHRAEEARIEVLGKRRNAKRA